MIAYQKEHSHKFRKFVEANPSLTQKEMAASMTICRALNQERQVYLERMKDVKPEEVVYYQQAVYEYGWGVKGERVYGKKE
ncbi:MAG: hypothetical protein RMI89_05805 [Gloeomargarita sp. SKYBB_i_bin120]|nr:hypothetical protein [Gloeomargarita sp. SKYB120]MDW8178040.1 hypothetical protein [Gloeomargarita sp. SKYBB_i_bin120]